MGWNRRLLSDSYEYKPPYLPNICSENSCLTEPPSLPITPPPNFIFTDLPAFTNNFSLPKTPTTISVNFGKITSSHRNLIILAISAVLAACFLILVYCTLLVRCCSLLQLRRRRRRRTTTTTIPLNPTPVGNGVEEEEEDDDLAEEDIHHIWYIKTVGLDQHTIDSITICPYRKADGLIDSTDCSVCLSEFDEGEIVRLLPKCSHAFHISCIDTWLRAHVNCPLCRAPIVSPPVTTPTTTTTNPTQTNSSSVAVSLQESGSGANSSENPQILQSNRVEGGGLTENSNTGIQITPGGIQQLLVLSSSTSYDVLESGFRVQSDLGRFGGHRVRPPITDGSSATVDLQQQTHRSISMDFSAMVVAGGSLYGEGGSSRQDRKESILVSRLPPISSSRAIMEKQWCGPKGVSTLGFGRSTSINGGNNKFFLSRFGRGIRSNSNSGNSILPP